MIAGSNKMADLVHMNYLLVSVINRFGIGLGFGDKTVDEVCKNHEVNVDFFLEIVNSFHDPNFFPGKNLQDFSIQFIIDYLGKTHQYYLQEKIPEIEALIEQMLVECYPENDHAQLIMSFFKEYKNELMSHISREDEVVFPYSLLIEKKYTDTPNSMSIEESSDYSISRYRSEHNDIEEKLFDLKNIIIKYLPSPQNKTLCLSVLTELFNLEKDMSDHSRIEDNVLIPKVILMEKEISRRNKS